MKTPSKRNRLHSLWPALEAFPGGAAVLTDWREQLGTDFDACRSLLRPTDEMATSYPAPPGRMLPYAVVEHGTDDFSGVDREGGPSIALKRSDILIYRLDVRKLGRQIAAAFGFVGDIVEGIPSSSIWQIGAYQFAGGDRFPVYLVLPLEPSDVQRSVESIVAGSRMPYVVITPTRQCVRLTIENILRRTNGHLAVLSEAIEIGSRQAWQCSAEALSRLNQFSDDLRSFDHPLSERAQCVLEAMLTLGAVNSDQRRSADQIAPKALCPDADGNSLKHVITELKSQGLVKTKSSRGGGCWLTPKGRIRAERLRRGSQTR